MLAVLLPLLTVGALLLVRGGDVRRRAAPADEDQPDQSATIVCPSALPGAPSAYLSTVSEGARGEVEVRAGSEKDTARLRRAR